MGNQCSYTVASLSSPANRGNISPALKAAVRVEESRAQRAGASWEGQAHGGWPWFLPPSYSQSSQSLGGYGTSLARVLSELQAKSASFLPLGEIEPATLAGGTSPWCTLVRVERVTAGFLLWAWCCPAGAGTAHELRQPRRPHAHLWSCRSADAALESECFLLTHLSSSC